ncbi:ribosomal-protein-alanine N-acetyltransferase [Falsibacillus albus]|uniref:[Ribosomal protein bS18]-alanine N-acetyltransferase n=2 Tax=Falsibacillus albus TaxID=2478915 RepID=A0A3L7JM86_9BACI|nr:ribosomal-protein-alanine N-acetyltransferase [Falsibacillus albus]
MTTEDLDGVLEVEKESFSIPWSREAFYNEIENNQFAVYIVAEMEGQIAGYCGVWLVLDEAHITNVAVLPAYRGMKIGQSLMEKTMDLAREHGAASMTLEVRMSNEPAQGLYRKLGFKNGGIRKRYYTDNQEDALIMWVNFNEQ